MVLTAACWQHKACRAWPAAASTTARAASNPAEPPIDPWPSWLETQSETRPCQTDTVSTQSQYSLQARSSCSNSATASSSQPTRGWTLSEGKTCETTANWVKMKEIGQEIGRHAFVWRNNTAVAQTKTVLRMETVWIFQISLWRLGASWTLKICIKWQKWTFTILVRCLRQMSR